MRDRIRGCSRWSCPMFLDFVTGAFDQLALETLGDYLGATAYNEETVRDRGVRSRAFIDGFEAALFIFKNAGLSRPQRCDGGPECIN